MLTPLVLENDHVRLEPLAPDHASGLAAAAAEDRSSYGFTYVPDGDAAAEHYVADALEQHRSGRSLPFAVRRLADGRVVGSTRYLDLERFTIPAPWPPGTPGPVPSDGEPPSVAEVGSTWYAASAQRTAVNTAAKRLLLAHAFETWRALRVTLKTDARNLASRRAIERLGAAFEGVRRAHLPATDGAIRDSAYYSILASEWPAVRARLDDSLARPRR